MRYRPPENNLLAESLEKDGRDLVLSDGENVGDAHLPYRHEVVLLCNSQGLHRDEVSHVRSAPDICESTRGEYLVFDFNLFRYDHGIWQSSIMSGKSPQGDEECLLLGGVEVVLRDALIKETICGGEEDKCESRLTWSNISTHNSASLRSRRETKALPSLSTKISARVRTHLASSDVPVIFSHSHR